MATETRLLTKRKSLQGYHAQEPWLDDHYPARGWRVLGDPAVHQSLPLSNLVSVVQDLIDPDFSPLTAILDDKPRFLKPLPSRMAPDYLEFLKFGGALSIPESGLRNELLRCYTQWVHSFMPVLNLQELLRSVVENDPNGNVSLLLFQAVMFVGTAFVDFKHLQVAGFATRKSARTAFYTRLRLLYSLDCEDDQIVILQTILLMTYWSEPENNAQRDIWDWIGICNTQAQSIGLNKDPSDSDMEPQIKRLRIRLWWSLYCRDRLIAMGMRRPTQVNEGTSNIPMLKLEDFDFEPFHPSVITTFRCPQLENVAHQKFLTTMFIEKVKLCQCIGRVLFSQYTPSQRQFPATGRKTITLIPRQASKFEFARCSQKLESWLSRLPQDAQFIPASRNNLRGGEDVLLLHGSMLKMLYHTTSSTLNRPLSIGLLNKDESRSSFELRNTACSKMQDAATGITQIIRGLNRLNLSRFLPQSGVTVVLPAAVAHLTGSISENPVIREMSIHNFQRCFQALHGLKDIYPAADMEVANIEAAIKMKFDNIGTFSKIMQDNSDDSIDTSQKRITDPTSQKQRDRSNIHKIGLSKDYQQTLGSLNNNKAMDEDITQRAQSEYNQTGIAQSRETSPILSRPEWTFNKLASFSDSGNDITLNSLHPADPFLSTTDLLRPDLDQFLSSGDFNSKPPATGDPEPDIDIDWTQEILRETNLSTDCPPSAVYFENYRDNNEMDLDMDMSMLSFVTEEDHMGGCKGDIFPSMTAVTGNLDKDLEFSSSDDTF